MIRDPLVASTPTDPDMPDASSGTRPLPPVTEADPVFVDATGGRARLGRRLGLAAGAVLIVFTGAVGLGLATGPNVPLTPWSEPSTRPSVRLSRPPTPAERPDGPRAASPEPARPPQRAAPAAPSRPSAADPAPPTTSTTTSRPGNSQATPPAWGRKKKKR